MPQTRVALAESLADSIASLQTARSDLSDAWAHRMSAFHNAQFAAVMGNSLTRNCREQGWTVEHAIRDDSNLVAAMQHYAGDAGPLYDAIADHVRWVLSQIEKEIVAEIQAHEPSFDPATDRPQQAALTAAEHDFALAQAEEDGCFRSVVMNAA